VHDAVDLNGYVALEILDLGAVPVGLVGG
jgi:hypothetical protein